MKYLIPALSLLLTGCATFEFQYQNARSRCFNRGLEINSYVDPILNIQWFVACGDTAEWAK